MYWAINEMYSKNWKGGRDNYGIVYVLYIKLQNNLKKE